MVEAMIRSAATTDECPIDGIPNESKAGNFQSMNYRRPAPTGRSSRPCRLDEVADIAGIMHHPLSLSRVMTVGVARRGLSHYVRLS